MNQKPNAILFPYPLQGHVIPFVNLAIKLASNGFSITFVNTQSVHHHILKSRPENNDTQDDDIFSGARESGLDIRETTIYDGFPIEFDRSLNHDIFFDSIRDNFVFHVDEIVGNMFLSTDIPSPNILIVDTFYVWGSTIANKYNLVNVSYWTEPALVLNVYYHMDLLRQNGHYDCNDKRQDAIDYIPGVKVIKPNDLASYLQSNDTDTTVHQILNLAFEDVKKADFIICNTIQELESETISALQEYQPVYALGPLFSPEFTKSPVSISLWSESDCTKWLENKPDGSVLYISFGSYAHTSKQNIMEIAHGLVNSKVYFIWVLRSDIVSSEETDYLPIGYEELIKDQGLIVPWCNQTAVLTHRAIGGFLTHCGWNSILESIWCNVPLICFPLLTDQFTNRKLVVDDLKIGVNLCDRDSITKDEVVVKVKHLIKGKTGEDMKLQLKKVRETVEDALTINGSSQVNFTRFINDVKSKVPKKDVVMAK